MASQKRLEQRVADLSNELHMSNLLNRGAIQSNQELSTQVDELRRENAILRTAERRLTDTEDKLEKCQDKLEKSQNKLVEKANEITRLKRTIARLEGEMVDAQEGLLDKLQLFVDQSRQSQVDRVRPEAGPSTPTPSAKRQSRQRDLDNGPIHGQEDDALTRSARRAAQSAAASASINGAARAGRQYEAEREEEDGAVEPRRNETSGKKRRRRIGEEDDDDGDDDPYHPSYGTAPSSAHKARPPSQREKKRPAIQLGIVKIESPDRDSDGDGWAEDDEDPL